MKYRRVSQYDCSACGREFTYKDKLTAMWMSHMDIECCGMVYVPTLFSSIFFYVLLSLSVISAFYVNAVVYMFIFWVWLAALCFIVPVFIKYRLKRVCVANARIMKRVYSNAPWHNLLAFIIGALGLVIICLREIPEDYFNVIVIAAVCTAAAAALFTLVVAIKRVLKKNRNIHAES